MTPLIGQVLMLVVPEILAAIKRKHEATGRMPTVEEVRAELATNVAKVVDEGAAWRAQNPDA